MWIQRRLPNGSAPVTVSRSSLILYIFFQVCSRRVFAISRGVRRWYSLGSFPAKHASSWSLGERDGCKNRARARRWLHGPGVGDYKVVQLPDGGLDVRRLVVLVRLDPSDAQGSNERRG